jgi:nitroreductase
MEPSEKILREIIADGVKAPSGENGQPWRFIIKNDTIYLINLIDKDLTLFNFGQLGSYVAHGALIENMFISASHYGLSADVRYFPTAEFAVIAKLVFKRADIAEDPLYPFLNARHTNRNDYGKQKIPAEAKQQLKIEAERLGLAKCVILDSDDDVRALADASTYIERLIVQSKIFHRFYYDHFFKKRYRHGAVEGRYIDSLGFGRMERFAVGLNRFWPVARLIGISYIWYFFYRMRFKHYANSAAFGAIITTSNDFVNYIDTGRSFERLWLMATKLGIELQPCVGTLYLYESLIKNKIFVFTERQQNMVRIGRNKILERFGDRGEGVPIFFRMGYAPLPTIRSYRDEPVVDYID